MEEKKLMHRRSFLAHSAMVGSGLLLAPDLFAGPGRPDSRFGGVQIGTITYSFRSMPGSVQEILRYCVEAGVSAIELMGDAAEAFAGSPAGIMPPMQPGQQRPAAPTPEMVKAREERAAKVREWRETVSMERFVELRRMFKKAGVSIYAFKPNALGERNSDAEVAYAMRAAKALGANSVTVELPRDGAQTRRLGEIAARHRVYVGYHAHTQATDTAWDEALAQSPYNSMNLDCGHYIAAGGQNTAETLLKLIEARHDRITSMHVKDRQTKEKGALNLEWGKGDTPLRGILLLMKEKGYRFPATIELEYEIPKGSDAVREVAKCVAFAKSILS